MSTKKTNTKIDIFSESAVHDYVSGHMSKDEEADFEEILASDESLQNAVEAEQNLRASLLDYERDQPKSVAISDKGIDALFATLDELDEAPCENTKTPWYNNNWYAAAGIAASLVLALGLFIGQLPDDVDNDFALLSDTSGSEEINFNSLIEAKKIAQVWLVEDLPETELPKLFAQHDLKPIGRAGSAWIVASSRTLSDLQLSNLEAVDKFEQVRLISYGDKTKS